MSTSTNSNARGLFWLGVWFALNLAINVSNKYLLSHTVFHLPILLTVAHLIFNAIGAKIVLYYQDSKNVNKKKLLNNNNNNNTTSSSTSTAEVNSHHQSLIIDDQHPQGTSRKNKSSVITVNEGTTTTTTTNPNNNINNNNSNNTNNTNNNNNNWILVAFTIIYCLNIAFGNICNKLVNLSFGTLFRSTIPIFIMVLSYFVMGTKPSTRVTLSVIPIVVGVAVTTQGEVEATIPSLVILFLGNMLSASKSVLSNRAMKEDNSNPVVLIDRLSLPSAVLSLFFAYLAGEIDTLMEIWDQITFFPLFLIVFTASVAFGLNWANFLAVKYTSALTMSVSANTKQVLVIVIGVLLFKNPVNTFNMIGCVIAIAGMSWYSYVRYQESQTRK